MEDVLQISFGIQGNLRYQEEREALKGLLVKWEPKRNSTWTRPKSAAAPFGLHAFGILSLGGDI